MQLFRNKYRDRDPVWHVQLAMILAIGLQLLLPNKYVFFSRFVVIALEVLLIGLLALTTPKEKIFRSLGRRINVYLLLTIAVLANTYALVQVSSQLLQSGKVGDGKGLILAALNIYVTNVIIFGLSYWEMDSGGPGERLQAAKHERDFLFPQNQNESYMHPQWQPTFVDYAYLSTTNAMAFSPTDTLPLSRRAKVLMALQATVSLVIVALVAARAVNILQ